MSTVEKELASSAAVVETEQSKANGETEETRRIKIEDRVMRYFQNKEIAKERNEENKLLVEELEELFKSSEEEQIIIPLPGGENAILSPRYIEKEVLDRDTLADEMQVPKDELKTPFDFCMFTAQGKLSPDMITRHTTVEREVKMKISKRKTNSRRSKSSQTGFADEQ